MAFTLADLLGIFALEPAGTDIFRGHSPAMGWRRVFGGLVVAQALVAMDRTVVGRPVHSLHGYFMLPGDPSVPITYRVERLRDGGSFTTRRCVASQYERPIFALTASFQAREPDGFEHAAAMPTVPLPEDLPSRHDLRAGQGGSLPPAVRAYLESETPIEIRPVDLDRYARRGTTPFLPCQAIWMRTTGPLPDNPALHETVLAYLSDMTLLDTALVPHGRSVFDPDIQAASLDHALWFHRPFRADDWLLYSEDSPSASGARGFTRGSIFGRDGTLVASVAQEGLIRRRRPR